MEVDACCPRPTSLSPTDITMQTLARRMGTPDVPARVDVCMDASRAL
jgi:hypothetical protein